MGIEGHKQITSTNTSKISSIDTRYRTQKPNIADFQLEQTNDSLLKANQLLTRTRWNRSLQS
jgi:hypothetical protein